MLLCLQKLDIAQKAVVVFYHHLAVSHLYALSSPFTRLWTKNFSKSIHNLNRGNLRKATYRSCGLWISITTWTSINLLKVQKLAPTVLQRRKRPIIILDSVRGGRLRVVQSSTHSIWAYQKWKTTFPFLLSRITSTRPGV